MSLTDAKRKANNKYIKENMTVLGCKVRKDKAEVFKTICKESGTTPNAVFTEAMNAFLIKHGISINNSDQITSNSEDSFFT